MNKIIESDKIILLGSGGHAKVLLDIIKKNNFSVLGIVEKFSTNTNNLGYENLGDDSDLDSCATENTVIVNGVGISPKNIDSRSLLNEKIEKIGFSFINMIHPSAIIANDVFLSDGCQIFAGSVIQPGSKIGSHSIINTSAIIDHDCIISNNTHIAPGVVISGGVEIGKKTFIGAGTNIANNIRIGKNCIIASGSAIYKDIPDNTNNF